MGAPVGLPDGGGSGPDHDLAAINIDSSPDTSLPAELSFPSGEGTTSSRIDPEQHLREALKAHTGLEIVLPPLHHKRDFDDFVSELDVSQVLSETIDGWGFARYVVVNDDGDVLSVSYSFQNLTLSSLTRGPRRRPSPPSVVNLYSFGPPTTRH